MTGQLSLSILEIIVLMLGAITLGVTIHFFITSRRSLKTTEDEMEGGKISKELSEWKLRYLNEIEVKGKEISSLQKRVEEAEENYNIYVIEAEEMRKENKKLLAQIKSTPHSTTEGDKPDHFEQLRIAQRSLLEHNEKINLLLSQIDIVKETEEKQQEILKVNEELTEHVDELKLILAQKEKEINNIRKKEHLTTEMTSILDSAYSEFNILQDKMQKLEHQVNLSKKINMEYEELKESNYRISQDFEESKLKYNVLVSENRQLKADYDETEEKLREANFQRQQLQKRVAYLEELNNDLQEVADTNKKLESQIKRIGELESMLNMVTEEKDEIAKRPPGL